MASKDLRGNLPFFLVLLLISGFLFLVDQQGWLAGIRGLIQKPIIALEEPLFRTSQTANQLASQLADFGKQDQQLLELEGRLRQLAIDQNTLSACLEEKEHLQKLLGAPLSPKWKFIEAIVVGGGEKLRLNQGRKTGVQEGMMVVTENILAGKVVWVGEIDSLVQLPTDPNSKISIVVKRPNSKGIQARGLLLGQLGGKLILDRVLQEEDVQKGDLVVTGGEEGWLPDLVIGQVEEVLPQTAAIYKKAIVASLIDYSALRIVFVVIP